MATAVVTGAASGIGRATASLLAERGHLVVAADIDEQGLADLGSCTVVVVADVGTQDGCSRIASAAEAAGDVRALVNNAGITSRGSVLNTPDEEWKRVLDVDLTSIFRLSRLIVPLIDRAGGGAIVNVASVVGVRANPASVAYAAAKAAVISLTRAMALDHAAAGIRVNCVVPGTVETALVQRAARQASPHDPEVPLRRWGRMQPLGRVGRPSEVASVIAFLLGEEASFVTGTDVVVDGGLLAALMPPY